MLLKCMRNQLKAVLPKLRRSLVARKKAAYASYAVSGSLLAYGFLQFRSCVYAEDG